MIWLSTFKPTTDPYTLAHNKLVVTLREVLNDLAARRISPARAHLRKTEAFLTFSQETCELCFHCGQIVHPFEECNGQPK